MTVGRDVSERRGPVSWLSDLPRPWVLATLVVVEAVWILDQDPLRGPLWWLPVVTVMAFHAALVAAERRRPTLSTRSVVAATVVVACAAVVASPYGSHDLYQYAMYGRMVVDHHANPYLTAPSAFPGDPLFGHLVGAWRHGPSVYGPGFTALSSVGALGYGGSVLLARLFFQLLAAGALVGSVAYLGRLRAGSAALVFLGLSPVLLATVNGGHNDLLAGALVLVGVDQARRDRIAWSTVALAAACLVKLSAGPAVAAVVLMLVVRRRWRAAGGLVAGVSALLAAGYATVGGLPALRPLGTIGHRASRASLWGSLRGGRLPLHGLHTDLPDLATLSMGILVLAVLAVVVQVWRARSRPVDAASMAVTLGSIAIFGSLYVLPWYPAVVLPVAALALGPAARRALHLGASALLLAYVAPPGVVIQGISTQPAGRLCGLVLAGVVGVAVVGRLWLMPQPAVSG